MKYRSGWFWALVISSCFLWMSQESTAHHSYLLTVQQLRAGLIKAPSPKQRIYSGRCAFPGGTPGGRDPRDGF
jgi:hypothetical protein